MWWYAVLKYGYVMVCRVKVGYVMVCRAKVGHVMACRAKVGYVRRVFSANIQIKRTGWPNKLQVHEGVLANASGIFAWKFPKYIFPPKQ